MTVNPDEVVALGAAVQVEYLDLFSRWICRKSSDTFFAFHNGLLFGCNGCIEDFGL